MSSEIGGRLQAAAKTKIVAALDGVHIVSKILSTSAVPGAEIVAASAALLASKIQGVH